MLWGVGWTLFEFDPVCCRISIESSRAVFPSPITLENTKLQARLPFCFSGEGLELVKYLILASDEVDSSKARMFIDERYKVTFAARSAGLEWTNHI